MVFYVPLFLFTLFSLTYQHLKRREWRKKKIGLTIVFCICSLPKHLFLFLAYHIHGALLILFQSVVTIKSFPLPLLKFHKSFRYWHFFLVRNGDTPKMSQFDKSNNWLANYFLVICPPALIHHYIYEVPSVLVPNNTLLPGPFIDTSSPNEAMTFGQMFHFSFYPIITQKTMRPLNVICIHSYALWCQGILWISCFKSQKLWKFHTILNFLFQSSIGLIYNPVKKKKNSLTWHNSHPCSYPLVPCLHLCACSIWHQRLLLI